MTYKVASTNCYDLPQDVICPTQTEIDTFDYYFNDDQARETLKNQQQNPDYRQLSCNPPFLIITNIMHQRRWCTIISPNGSGGTTARFVYFAQVNTQNSDRTRHIYSGYELVPDRLRRFVFYLFDEFGGNICAAI
ncbi:hypothetical protein [Bacillus pumilus]|uniref:hypothetical protein n=1 Tax=Bacillus pumilus TaxID=1408 RepID=UPI000D03FF7E|nr:hypothetical protein [Bacillus pumilus]PRS29883.1 hypothetical protein C6X99_01695 [Bacillus pumilus]